ncbi:unnamed protein product, partial [Coregonus sp. 'balchen']
MYLQACKLVGVVPVSYFLQNLGTSTMSLNHHGVRPLGGGACHCPGDKSGGRLLTHYQLQETLIIDSNVSSQTDRHVTNLELVDNYLLADSARYPVVLLKVHFTIQHLNNYRVKELDLSHSQFCGRGGEHLGQIANDEGLAVLDLSWNHLQMKGVVAFCAGLKVNVTLKHLDLSWNIFGNEGALTLGEALKFNNTDLNNNHITNERVGMQCKGLEANDTLRVLMLAYNSLTVEGALALVTVVKKTPKTALEEINILESSLAVQYGGVGGFIAKKSPKFLDPMIVIQ